MANTAWISGPETRQCMIRVWLVISAIWLTFWAVIAAVVVAIAGPEIPLWEEIRPFSWMVLAPPILLLSLGVMGRCAFLVFARPIGRLTRPALAEGRPGKPAVPLG